MVLVEAGGASMSALAHGALTGIEAGDKVASVSYGGVVDGLSLLSDDDDSAQQIRGGRRSLLAKYMETSTLRFLEADTDEGVYPWAKQHLVSVSDMVGDISDTEKENYRPFLFWHIPK